MTNLEKLQRRFGSQQVSIDESPKRTPRFILRIASPLNRQFGGSTAEEAAGRCLSLIGDEKVRAVASSRRR